MANTNIGDSIIDSMKSENLGGLLIDSTELILDQFIETGLFNEIPVFGTLTKIYGSIKDIQTALLAKKLYYFLYEIKNTDSIELNELIAKLEKRGNTNLGEAIINVINKADDTEKAIYIGKLFSACSKRMFSSKRLLRLIHIVNNMYIADLKALCKIDGNNEFSEDEIRTFLNVGLMDKKLEKRVMVNTGIPFGITRDKEVIMNSKFNINAYIIAEILFNINKTHSIFRSEVLKRELIGDI